MEKLVTLVVALLTMTLLSSGTVLAAAPQITGQATAPATVPAADQTTAQVTAPAVAATVAQEQANPHSLASRSAAAKRLKAVMEIQNAASGSQTK